MDADLKSLYDSPDANVGNKLFCIQLQMFRDFQSGIMSVGTEANFANDLKKELYVKCMEKACDLRRQQMSTTTSVATEDDIIADIDRITNRLYSQMIVKITGIA